MLHTPCKSVFALFVFLLLALLNAEVAISAECWDGTIRPAHKEIKQLIDNVRNSGAISASIKKDIIERYRQSIDIADKIINGTHPFCGELANYDKELEDYESQVSSYSAEVRNFESQCGGELSPPQYNKCVSWQSNLNSQKQRLDSWKANLDGKVASLNKRGDQFNKDNEEFDIRLLADMKSALDSPVEIVVKRTLKPSSGGCTLGELWVNGEFFSYTLELPFKNDNNNFSSIAVGRYDAFVGSTGHKPNGVIQLKNVESVVYYNDNGTWRRGNIDRNAGGAVEIHSGTKPRHSKGCILIADYRPDINKCELTDSSERALNRLYKKYFGDEIKPDPRKKVTVTIQTAYE